MKLFKHLKTGNILELKKSGTGVSTMYVLNAEGVRVKNSLINTPIYQTRVCNNKYLVHI